MPTTQGAAPNADDSNSEPVDVPTPHPLQRLANLFPPVVSEGLEVDGWIWLSYLQNNTREYTHAWDGEVSLAITKSFNQRVAFAFEGNFIDANDARRVELEQGFMSARLGDQTLLTIGKFNANFGTEARDFWDRRTGTTSLLFAAQPQDLLGVMLTQPIGRTGVTLRPFVSVDFQGGYNFDQAPSAGLMVEYAPTKDLSFAVTNWVGPGFVLYGGHPLRSPFPGGGYGDDGTAVAENWEGPHLMAESGGTLYFAQARAVWRPSHDLTLSAEYLLARTGTSRDDFGWAGWMFLADYDVTDRLHIFGRYSGLNDPDWLVTGIFQKCREVSAGFGYQIHDGVEARIEYRHDFSSVTPDFDSVSAHLTIGF